MSDNFAYFESITKCFQPVNKRTIPINDGRTACGGTLHKAFNLTRGRVEYVWCPECGHIYYEHPEHKKDGM